MASNGQKFIGRNRPPRVQIEYDVEIYGSEKKVQLPFVMGVMADILGAQETPPVKLDDRKFLEFDHDNFDSRMRAMSPRLATSVPNKLSNEGGTLPVELKFRSMEDFSPTAIAQNVEPLRRLLEARKRLSDLISYMDGRGDAEALISAGLKDPKKLHELAASLTTADTSTSTTKQATKPEAQGAAETGAHETGNE
jgi:type VI secretion system protein ImpB